MGMNQRRIITIDGPAGAGKSTIARALAGRLGLEFLDTGAMYRAVAAATLEAGIAPADGESVGALAQSLDVRFCWEVDPPRLIVNGKDLTSRLREPEVNRAVKEIAGNPRVRAILVHAQRGVASEHPRLVSEGRDQGSVVFPDAQVKFFLEASPQVRAARRAAQDREAGREAEEGEILRQIVERDKGDQSREQGPLICPQDAIRVDSSGLGLEEVLARMERMVEERTRQRRERG